MKKFIYVIIIAISLIAMCGCDKEYHTQSLVEPVTNDTGYIWITIDFTIPTFTYVAGYRRGNEYFMPECHYYTTGDTNVNVDVTNIAHGFYKDSRAKKYFKLCK